MLSGVDGWKAKQLTFNSIARIRVRVRIEMFVLTCLLQSDKTLANVLNAPLSMYAIPVVQEDAMMNARNECNERHASRS